MRERKLGVAWLGPLGLLAAFLVVGGLVATMFLGTQVSGILSTVGAPVGPYTGVQDPGGNDDPGMAEEPAGGGAGNGSSGGSGGAGLGLLDVARPDLLIIKTGEISIQAGQVDPALAEATEAIVALGGYASGSERSGDEHDARATTTFRIPAARWEDALIAIRGVGDKVLGERTETVDVTGEVVDLQARIRNLQVTERAFQAIMDRAVAIKDVLDVQAKLTEVRGEIERLTSKAGQLQEQAAMSTLKVEITVRPAPVVAQQEAQFDPGTEAESATAHLVSILQALEKVGIWFGIVWLPILLSLSVMVGIGWFVVRRVRRAGESGTPIVAAPEGGA